MARKIKSFIEGSGKFFIIAIIVLFLVPFFGRPYLTELFVMGSLMAIFAASWDTLLCADQFSLGHSFFFGVGGYSTAFLVIYFNASKWIAFISGPFIAMGVAAVIAIPFLRMRRMYYTLGMVGLAILAELIIPKFSGITGGEEGLRGIPQLVTGLNSNFYLTVLIMLGSVLFMYYLTHCTDIGLILSGMREDEDAAQSLGINISKYRVFGMVVAGFFAGLAGSMWCHYYMIAIPWFFTVIPLTILIVEMSLAGGMTTIIGPAIGAIFLTILGRYLPFSAELRLIVYGVLVILILYYFPRGLYGFLEDELFS